MKVCSKCKFEKPESDFYLEGATRKTRANCKECHIAKQKAYYNENREEIVAKQKVYQKENREERIARQKIYYAENREGILIRQKNYNVENREKKLARQKIHYAENREGILIRQKNYDVENREEIAAYRKENREKRAARRRVYMYGITPDAYKNMLADQGGACAICGGLEGKRSLCIDHDHDTGKVRGLICQSCNKGIGHLKDSSNITRRATEYLKKYGK